MKTILLDTNAILRFVLSDVPKQRDEVKSVLYQAKANTLKVVIPLIVIPETIYVLLSIYKFSKKEICSGLKTLLSLSYISVENQSTLLIALAKYEIGSLSFLDIYLYQFAKQNGYELLTFDKKLQKISKIN